MKCMTAAIEAEPFARLSPYSVVADNSWTRLQDFQRVGILGQTWGVVSIFYTKHGVRLGVHPGRGRSLLS